MPPGTRLRPHCGQSNLRLFMQMGIFVPDGVKISVGGIEKSWKKGKVLILDDSFVHGVKHDGKALRVTMNIPVWHPHFMHRMYR
mmetsp:Transcript_36031/g.78679  ORF Transcript_36031/g.78679 Transcript_36031/m.78679 type:complete len:84 (-) Transcript_36031:79-330(-)